MGAPEPVSIEAVLADQIAAGRARLMTLSVTQREAEDRVSPGADGLGEWCWQRGTPRSGVLAGGLAIGSS